MNRIKPSQKDIDQILNEEDRRMQELRRLVDRTEMYLRHGLLSYANSQMLIEQTRKNAVELFPDKGYVFDLIYRPRFCRILDENSVNDMGR